MTLTIKQREKREQKIQRAIPKLIYQIVVAILKEQIYRHQQVLTTVNTSYYTIQVRQVRARIKRKRGWRDKKCWLFQDLLQASQNHLIYLQIVL